MTSAIEQFFTNVFGDNIILATILIAIVPLIELKGAIPFSMSYAIWGELAFNKWQALLFASIGSCLVVPILALIYLPIINLLKRTKLFKKLALKIENRINLRKQKIEKRSDNDNLLNAGQGCETCEDVNLHNLPKNTENMSQNGIVKNDYCAQNKLKTRFGKPFLIKLVSVFLFVCVPLPLTGVWTGTCLAVALGLGFWWSCLAVIMGNIVSGLIVTTLSSWFGQNTIILFYILIALIVVMLLISLIAHLLKTRKKRN